MNIILKKGLHGAGFGLLLSGAVYVVCFFIELFTFIKELLAHTSLTDDVMSGNGANAGTEYTIADYTPLLPIWNWVLVLIIIGSACVIGGVIGLIIGGLHKTDRINKVHAYNMTVLEDGSDRQKIQFASGIKTMAEALTQSCSENLYYMTNFVEAKYTGEAANAAIMTELVKFVEYEQTIKSTIESNSKEGGC